MEMICTLTWVLVTQMCIQLNLKQHRWLGAPHTVKIFYNPTVGPMYSQCHIHRVSHGSYSTAVCIFYWKNSINKKTCAVQTHVFQGSTEHLSKLFKPNTEDLYLSLYINYISELQNLKESLSFVISSQSCVSLHKCGHMLVPEPVPGQGRD